MKFIFVKNFLYLLFACLLILNTIKTKSNLKATSESSNKNNKSQVYLEPKTYTKFDKKLLKDLDNFTNELSEFNHKKYSELLGFSAKINSNDIIINNSGMKDHLFRFAQKKKISDNIDKKKVNLFLYFLCIFLYFIH